MLPIHLAFPRVRDSGEANASADFLLNFSIPKNFFNRRVKIFQTKSCLFPNQTQTNQTVFYTTLCEAIHSQFNMNLQ